MGDGVRLAPVTLLAGIGTAVGTVAVYQWWWGLVLAAAATVLLLLATPPGWALRLPLALGFVGTIAMFAVRRGEGDYLVASTGQGYVVLGLALLVLCVTIATLPRPGGGASRTSARTSGAKAPVE
ncbi:hypothetical protein [Nocardioides halotolerans]|jgi:hypothetical protein|uniref:hypothetical protein n=1 Tax=Nocardioides halotolerans TaxID=433660 RepID=UPI00041727D8|nr:hypothetical protein [Nocardioides halotolerans]